MLLLRRGLKRWASAALVALGLAGLSGHLVVAQQAAAKPVVYLLKIDGVVDLGLAPFVKRVLNQATEVGAAAVILEIDTFGGRVDAAVHIRDALLDAKVRTVGFVNKRAISAGALIGLATQTLAMSTGGTLGAAAPVVAGATGTAAQPADEKMVSYMRKEFRATAEARRRPLLLAEAMADADVVVPGVVDKGKLLTLTTDEALQHKVADLRADTLDQVLAQLGLEGAEVRTGSPHWAEQLVRFLTHPVLSSLLISVGLVGIIVELRTPGFGIPGGIGLASLGIFFWGHWLVQLAGWEEMLLAAGGLALLAAEIFLIPGFGVAGALGIAALLGALVLGMTGAGDTATFIAATVQRVVITLLAALLAAAVLLRFVRRLPLARRLVLEADLGSGPAHGSAPLSDQRWLGRHGRTVSVLRPAGIAEIEGERVDVVSDGALIEPGTAVEVMYVNGNRIVVRQRSHPPLPSTPTVTDKE